MNAVMVRIFGFPCAEAGGTTAASRKPARKTACQTNGKTCAELPLLRNIKSSSEVRGNTGNALADDQAMNVVRALVGVHRFEIVHVAHDAVIVDDAIGAPKIRALGGPSLCHNPRLSFLV